MMEGNDPDKKIRCGAGCPVPWINEKDEENRRTGRKERKGRNETGKVIYKHLEC